MPLRSLLVSASVVVLSTLSLSAQALERVIPLTDNDPSSMDHPFGITLDPSGTSAYVPLCGLPAFSNFAASNNDNIVKVDLWTGAQLAVGQTELFPEDACVVKDATGQARHVYVSNSTSGTISCLTPGLAPVATITLTPCWGSVFFSVFPFGMVASPDGNRIYVTTAGGCGTIDVIDSDPASPTFNTVVQSFTVQDCGGRPEWLAWPNLLVPITTYDANYTTSRAGFSVVDVTNPANQQAHLVSSIPFPFQYHFATEVHALSNGRVLVTIGGEVYPTFYECLSNGTVTRSVSLNTLTGINLHGLAVDPEERIAVLTSISGSDTIWVDLATFTVVGVFDHGGISKPNDVVFAPDGSRAFVTMQGLTQIDVMAQIPGYTLALDVPITVATGGVLNIGLRRCESGRPWALWASLSGSGPLNVGGYNVLLTAPFYELIGGVGAQNGTASASFAVPAGPSFAGFNVSFQAVTLDRDGSVRLSNGASTTTF